MEDLNARAYAFLDLLLTVIYVAGAIGILLSLFLIIRCSPKGPRR